MDVRLFEILAELQDRPEVRAVIWRGEGKSFSRRAAMSPPSATSSRAQPPRAHAPGHCGIQQLFDLDAPIIVAIQGWAIGGSFQRALLCDIRVAAEGARFMLPEVGHGVIPDTGGVGRLFQICGPGVVSDMVLTGPADGRRGGARPRDRVPGRRRPTSSTPPSWRWPSRSPRRRR